MHKKKRANAKQGQAFRQISEEAKMLIHQRLSTHTSPRCYQSGTYTRA
nr:hypothetical protein [Piscirickettsia salmonis]